MSSQPAQFLVILQPIARRRCASCDRWRGPRSPGPDAASVAIADEAASGDCAGGPWDGQMRSARSACGRWLRWTVLPEAL